MTEDLKKIFRALIQTHEQLNELARRKQKAVTKGDIDGLDQTLKQETPLIARLNQLEKARQTIVHQWLRENGIAAQDATMEQLMPAFSRDDQEEFRALYETLAGEITALQEQNDLNRQLIEDSLKFVHLTMDAVQPGQMLSDNYSGRGGDDSDDKGRSLFDSKA
ncbi:flagellar protein FlgN [Alkalicoccus urumqiensis]|uniref:Flagellar protein FlgN n=1 Tax=Alkalicoccus urumqiensis TaxID=1548213 RepID=A0A2P6MH93_ALKUR|nr:flagellar protein FlgN [Alkalicoccus urumqiensis]PRO65665.1 hypothetical protein C6I21_09080 [Alkalicoccus urumqiensis]